MDRYESEKYNCTKETVCETLNKYGVAVIPSLLDAEECEKMTSGMWDYLEHVTQKFDVPILRKNPSTYKSFSQLFPLHSMLVQRWGVGHAQFMWDLRSNKKIIDVFANIWKTDNLVVSFDGASFHLPPEVTGKGYLENVKTQWLHTDQSFTRNGAECVQSWVTALPVNPGDATLTFLEGSHKFHGECAKVFNIQNPSDWNKLTSAQMKFYLDNGCLQKSISCPAGSLVLWDSRTIHSGQESMKSRKKMNTRFVAYLCYMPREGISEKILGKRISYFKELRTTNHWACDPKPFPREPQTYGKPFPRVVEPSPPVLDDVGKSLI